MISMLVMIILHSASGVEIDVNIATITNMRSPEPGNKNFTPDVRCLINMSDGKFVTVRETCEEVRRVMEARKKSIRERNQ
jgi:hypothetical protein